MECFEIQQWLLIKERGLKFELVNDQNNSSIFKSEIKKNFNRRNRQSSGIHIFCLEKMDWINWFQQMHF